ncbi:MAG: zf-HC2 domain-containing protein [Bacteroidales bacterium]
MKCSEVYKQLFQYLDGELSEIQKKRIEEHLESCASCRSICENSREAWNAARIEEIPYQPFFYTRLKQKMENREGKSVPAFARIGKAILQPALYFIVLGLGIYIGVYLGQGAENQSETTSSIEQTNYIEGYAKSHYLNGMELETVEQEMLTENQAQNGENNE